MGESNEIKYYYQAQIAKELKTSQATISRIINQNAVKPAKMDGKKRLFSEQQVKEISFILSGKQERQAKKLDNIDVSTEWKKEIEELRKHYQKELEVKNNQIDQLNEQLKMAQINLNQSQQLQLEQSKKIKELEGPAKKRHWWQWW